MNTLTVEKSNVIAAEKVADQSTKTVLRALFPSAFEAEQVAPTPKFGDIRDRIKTKQDVLIVLCVSEPSFSEVDESEREYMRNLWWWRHIAKALNEGWIPDWRDSNEYKYYGWAYYQEETGSPSGVGLSNSVYADTDTNSSVGSRLCFKSSTLVRYAQEQFADVWKGIMLP